jgi:acyl carrier protein
MSMPLDAASLTAFIRDTLLNGREITSDEDLLLSSLLDSLGVMSLVAFIETQLGATVPPEDITLENFTSVDTILSYLSAGRT